MAKALVLFQYQVSGEALTSFNVTYEDDVTETFNELPFFYCVNVIKREDHKVTPVGGFLIKTDLAKDDPKLQQYMYETAQQLDKVSEILPNGNSIQVVPTKYDSAVIPDENKCEELAVNAMLLYGWGGSA